MSVRVWILAMRGFTDLATSTGSVSGDRERNTIFEGVDRFNHQ